MAKFTTTTTTEAMIEPPNPPEVRPVTRNHDAASGYLNALLSHIEHDPLAALSACAFGKNLLETVTRMAIHNARNTGATWAQVGAALGTSKQAAYQKYSDEEAG